MSATERAARNVRALRKSSGLRLRDLAERVAEAGQPMHVNTLSKVERGTRSLSVAELEALATVFGVSDAAELLAETPPRKLPAEPGAVVWVTRLRGRDLDPPVLAVLGVRDDPWHAHVWVTPALIVAPDQDDEREASISWTSWHTAKHIEDWIQARIVRDGEHGPAAALRDVVRLLDGPQSELAQQAQDVAKAALRRMDGGEPS